MNKLLLAMLILGNSLIASAQPGMNVNSAPKKAARTTSVGGRWYNYADSFYALAYRDTACLLIDSVQTTKIDLWNDTTSISAFGGISYRKNKLISLGLNCRPSSMWWNNPTYFAGEISVTDTDDYVVDSVIAIGAYGRNPAKPWVVDTMKFGVVYGNGDTSSGDLPKDYAEVMTFYCADTLVYLSMIYDSVNNCASNNYFNHSTTTASRQMTEYPLYESDSASDHFSKAFALSPSTGGYHVPRGNTFAVSLTFISGDNTYPGAGDTIYRLDGSYKYNSFRPEITYQQTSGYMVSNYDALKDWTTAYYNKPGDYYWPTNKIYTPHWRWHGTDTPYQFPGMIFHVSCPTCRPIPPGRLGANTEVVKNSINIYPNPANDVLNIDMGSCAGAINFTLTNMIGQIVAIQTLQSGGHSIINTRNLNSGIYIYNVSGSGNNTSGKIYISH